MSPRVSAKSRDFGKNFRDIGETISKKHAVETSGIRDCMKLKKNTLSQHLVSRASTPEYIFSSNIRDQID